MQHVHPFNVINEHWRKLALQPVYDMLTRLDVSEHTGVLTATDLLQQELALHVKGPQASEPCLQLLLEKLIIECP